MSDVKSLSPVLKESYSRKVRSPFEKLKTRLKRSVKSGKTEGLKKTTERMK